MKISSSEMLNKLFGIENTKSKQLLLMESIHEKKHLDLFILRMQLNNFMNHFLFAPGFFCPSGSAYPHLCEAGFYCNRTGLDVPAGPCAAGFHCPWGSSDPYANPCPTGHYCPMGTPLPIPCPLGTIKREIFKEYVYTYILLYMHRQLWLGG